MQLLESGQMYLETIYILSGQQNVVRSLDVADYMNFSPPSVCRAMGILKKQGLIVMDKEGLITMTEEGREYAAKIYERHTLLTAVLMRLGVDEENAVRDACKMEHDISDATFDAIKSHIQKWEDDSKVSKP